MKILESWLREWVNPKLTQEKLCTLLTLSGFEVEEVVPVINQGKKDAVIDLSITPNRGDCLSLRGMAREVAAITSSRAASSVKPSPFTRVRKTKIKPLTVKVTAKADCPRYVSREVRNVKANATTPTWLKERLEHCGINSISPIVDVTNYVMLELGQPMHAFDLDKIERGIQVRLAKQGEKISLLDGSEKTLTNETLIIADAKNPLAIAGVMGDLDSSVTLLTTHIFLESAFFNPQTIAKQRQYYNLNSDSSYRFERGIDPTIQKEALERATQLIINICGGEAGPVVEVTQKKILPTAKKIALPQEKVSKLLGLDIPTAAIKKIFTALQFSISGGQREWKVTVPAYRFDINLPEDLIEEIARLYGYDKIPTHPLKSILQSHTADNSQDLYTLKQAFSNHGYHEIVSYSFIDKKLQQLLDPTTTAKELLNPISADMAVMRTTMWPGLISTWMYNCNRQQPRARLFEIGTCFKQQGKRVIEELRLSGLLTGEAHPEQWGSASRKIDFYDVKGDLEDILAISLVFKPESHSALHPGQTAGIYLNEQKIGMIGLLHPSILAELQLSDAIFVFELNLNLLKERDLHSFKEISKFPEIRRDLALLVDQTIPAAVIQDTIKVTAGDWLKDSFIFDVYQGKGITPGLKSIALALILQHPTRTLIDDEVTALLGRVIQTLKDQLGAVLRS